MTFTKIKKKQTLLMLGTLWAPLSNQIKVQSKTTKYFDKSMAITFMKQTLLLSSALMAHKIILPINFEKIL